MVYKIIGWVSILLCVLALAPSFVPGAVSMIGLLISMVALIMSILSIKTGNVFYFKTAVIITGFGIFAVNDGLRLYDSIPHVTWQYKLGVYCIFIMVCIFGCLFVKRNSSLT